MGYDHFRVLPPQCASSRHALVPATPTGGERRGFLLGGFTLIEILVVIVVIAVLATLVAPNVFKHVGETKTVTARSQIEMLGAATP